MQIAAAAAAHTPALIKARFFLIQLKMQIVSFCFPLRKPDRVYDEFNQAVSHNYVGSQIASVNVHSLRWNA